MNKGLLFDIERNSFVDGPGIRTTVFFKGCNLRCKWCHNPESWLPEPQMLFYANKCTGCGKCLEVCPNHGESCTLCGRCELFCPGDARKICGREWTVEEVFAEIIKDKTYYENSGGGVTFSGGECMLQVDFLLALLKKCKENGIHTAVDTAGNVSWESFEKVLPYTDLFLYDLKCFSEELHKSATGVSNRRILENLERLAGRAALLIRVPVIPSINDGEEELRRMAEFLRKIQVNRVEVLPYHKMGEHKYDALKLKCQEFAVPSKEQMERIQRLFVKKN